MALAYAFIDDAGNYHGEHNDQRPTYEFAYMPASGPFVGRRLTMHAASWDGFSSEIRIYATATWSCLVTEQVAAILWPHRPSQRPGR